MKRWNELDARMTTLFELSGASGILGWDQETYMPSKAAAARARQQAALQTVVHEKLCDPVLGELIDEASASDTLDEQRRAAVRVLRRDRDRAVKVPARLISELALAQGHGVEAWRVAREESRFEHFRPHLEKLIALRREQADALGHEGERYDALLDHYEPGMTTARLKPILARLRDGLVPLVEKATSRQAPRPDFLFRDAWDVEQQFEVCRELLVAMGFDFEAGRLDRSTHPFCGGVAPYDVRLTTRLYRDNGASAIFSALHEGGHGLYEQGLPNTGNLLCGGASMGLHESQSRLWENLVGRSRAFWSFHFPVLKKRFATALEGIDLDGWIRGINHVERSLIRVEADELTYNLHILIRFELELEILSGALDAADLPEAWNARYERFLGVRPPNDAQGVLQDIHWAWGELGYFPTYSLGNMYACTLAKAAERAVPGLWDAIGGGELTPLRDWLRRHVHRHGRAKDPEDIVTEATGTGLTETDLLDHLRAKYTDA